MTSSPAPATQGELALGALFAMAADDTIHGGARDQPLYILGGDDVIDGGAGTNTLDKGDGVDLASYADATGPVSVSLLLSGAQASGFGVTTLVSIEGLIGGHYNDTLVGDAGDNVLVASGGDDTVQGGGGRDELRFAGFAHDYHISAVAGGGEVAAGPEGGATRFGSVETLEFLDGTLSFDVGSTAAQIVRLYDSFLGRTPDLSGFDSYLRFRAKVIHFRICDQCGRQPGIRLESDSKLVLSWRCAGRGA